MGYQNVLLRSQARLTPGADARRLRVAAKLSLRDVAEALGVAPATVLRYETGARSPRGAIAERYARFLAELEKRVGVLSESATPAVAGIKASRDRMSDGEHTAAG